MPAELQEAWRAAAEASRAAAAPAPARVATEREQFLVLVTCRDERHQVEILQRFQAEGVPCRALLS